ncbi:MAG: MFS transporter [Bryobacteraceae bacterium]
MSSDSNLMTLPASARTRAAQAGFASLILLSIAHFFIDLYASAISIFQPLLVDKLHLSLTQAGILGGLLVFSSSVLQPAYGYLSDRFQTRMFSVLAPAVAGIFISALAVAPSYAWAAVLILLGGAGIASFHPQATARATVGLSGGRGRAMAIFISSGTLGMALGPSVYSQLLEHLGAAGAGWAVIPGLVVTGLLVVMLPDVRSATAHRGLRSDWRALSLCWKPLTILYFLVFIRSIIHITYAQFLPLYLHRERDYSLPNAAFALTAYLAAGALGGFVGGHLSDRFGGRFVILISMIACVPFLALFFLTGGLLSIAGLSLGGLILLFTIPVNVVMAQELAPEQAGTVSALMMGFAWGMAGLMFIPLTGWLSDHFSMESALAGLLIFPVIGFFLTLLLPRKA